MLGAMVRLFLLGTGSILCVMDKGTKQGLPASRELRRLGSTLELAAEVSSFRGSSSFYNGKQSNSKKL